jgi:hypothetical protein
MPTLPRSHRALLAVLLVLSSFVPTLPTPQAGAQSVCSAPPNPVVAENCLPGSPPSEWDLIGVDSSAIAGFATEISVNRGQTVRFKITTTANAYRIDVYRLGYYGGNGARKVATIPNSATQKQRQPACRSDAPTGLIDCGNWAQSASWAVPASAASGVYLARLVREGGTAGGNHISFVVRDDASRSDLLYQTSDTTWVAYNNYGGNSLYVGSPAGRAYKVSYNRPFVSRFGAGWGFPLTNFFDGEYPMVRWLEANGYDVSYTTGVESDRRGDLIRNHKTFLSVGHDEYWSGQQRANVEAAREAGVHLAFFAGNEVFWKTRWENSIDGSGTPYRTLVSYKETLAGARIDPTGIWTGTWRDPRFSPPADGGRPENRLTGTAFMVQEFDDLPGASIQVPAADGQLRFWRNTNVAAAGATLSPGTLGFEWNEDLENGFRPPGLMRLSSTTLNVSSKLLDYGSSYGAGTATHALTLYRHRTKNGAPSSSGALVFSAATIQWSWGLDAVHDRSNPGSPADQRVRQATVNLLADMGAQPRTLQSGLVGATASTDATAPTSQITSPAPGANLQVQTTATISGTASDGGGGVVGGVEVSTDGGASWQRANGRGSWSYSWTPNAVGPATIKSRAVDDSGNLETPGAGVSVTVNPRPCPCSIWSSATTPAVPSQPDGAAVELGVKFRADVAGQVTGIRFYKGSGNTGTHVGHLWTSAGTLLASATFTGESASGWQQVNFAAPVSVAANTTYVASYYAPVGRYAVDQHYFTTARVSPPLTALANGADGPNGLYRYGSGGGFPTSSYLSSNYWVDVVFATGSAPPDTTPPTISGVQATGITSTGATIGWTTDEAADTQVDYGLTTSYGSSTALNPGLVISHSQALTGLAASTLYHYRVKSRDAAGNLRTSGDFTFTTAAPPSCPCTIWASDATPALASENDPNAVELGVRFRAASAGRITGLRFYKGSGNTGTHVAHLWSSTGTLLATATFSNETATGWQQVNFATPVNVAANTTYVASYYAPVGRYAKNEGYFASAVTRGPLTALADGADGPNGVYRYGSGGGFPSSTYLSSNYWVDVVFSP